MNNTAFMQTKQPKRPTAYTNDSILEAIRDLSGGVGKTVTRDLAGRVAGDALASILAVPVRRGVASGRKYRFSGGTTAPPRDAPPRGEAGRKNCFP